MELHNWINHSKNIKKELVNLIGICNKDLKYRLDDDNSPLELNLFIPVKPIDQ